MHCQGTLIRIIPVFCFALTMPAQICHATPVLRMTAPGQAIAQYHKLELSIGLDRQYANPFDPDQVDLSLHITTPTARTLVLPAFYGQDYERRKLKQGQGQANWYYPLGRGAWKARFAPGEVGQYSAVAVLTDQSGTQRSNPVRFLCQASQSKGYVQVSPEDPRFLALSEGEPFFAIGQNMAFVGETQYVNLTKAEEVFHRLSQNGANFVRVWTCCEDWALALEAPKSAWQRSWNRNAPIVDLPETEMTPAGRKGIRLTGPDGKAIEVSPSHRVGLRPNTTYRLSGRFLAQDTQALQVQLGGDTRTFPVSTPGQWQRFQIDFSTGKRQMWLSRMTLGLVGAGTVYIDALSLQEAAGSAELLWEADVNRPVRGVYNQLDCFMLDQLVEAAEQNGICLMLCLFTRDLYMKDLSAPASQEYQEAIRDAQALLRYAVARWGYSTSVGAWEYFNEMDPGKPTDHFYDELGRYLEQIDAYGHLRATSTWHPSARDCQHGRLDIGQLHHYMRPHTPEEFKDEVACIIDKTRFLRQNAPDKPAFIGEFGLATEKWGLSDYMKEDDQARHFHNSLWASALAGNAGTAMFWWWEQLDKQDAYKHYRPLADFLSGVSLAGLERTNAQIPNPQIHVLGYQGEDWACFWLCHKDSMWWSRIVDGNGVKETSGTVVEIRGLQPGHYDIEWWNTYSGKIVYSLSRSIDGPSLRLSAPTFRGDIACKIRRKS